jgi:phosphoglycerate dehydrogenase-like enzyme
MPDGDRSERRTRRSATVRVVVAGADPGDRPPGLDAMPERVRLAYAGTADDVRRAIPGADVVLAWSPRREFLEPALEHASRLRWIQSASAGVDGLLFPALVESDVVVTNARGVFDAGMAEYAVACLLAFAKDLPATIARARERAWRHRETEPLAGRRALIVGAGAIGTEIARVARALGMRVEGVASERRAAEEPFERIVGVGELLAVLREADYVVNVLPATARTTRLFDDRAFAAMRPTARFLNLGRGATVDEGALVRALRDGGIAGAALDVFEVEPLPQGSPLWSMPNVIVSPHMSGDLVGWRQRVVDLFRDNLGRFMGGEPLRNVVDKRRGYVPSAPDGAGLSGSRARH